MGVRRSATRALVATMSSRAWQGAGRRKGLMLSATRMRSNISFWNSAPRC